ncbi:MAG: nucleotidyltransferase domain-containing protein [Actinobacteria bacterium]|nr:nucleotidyltransferase domain-containing protein [Planctomycetota bacterium]MBU4403346.1 nucleotidyltransferase domain-containing protein [Actinomycetota bacterium]MCG2819731.1 nucleotidyltransferase domain-containing protein [Actinomycetes bacterium]
MKLNSPLDEILGSRVKVQILRLLCLTGSPYTGREISRLIKRAQNRVRLCLDEFEAIGIVSRRSVGTAKLFQLSTNNIIVNDVLVPLFKKEASLIAALGNHFFRELSEGLDSLILFGSVARGEGSDRSDIDLMIVLNNDVDFAKTEARVFDTVTKAQKEFGLPILPIVVTRSEYDSHMKEEKGMWKSVREEGIPIVSEGGGII